MCSLNLGLSNQNLYLLRTCKSSIQAHFSKFKYSFEIQDCSKASNNCFVFSGVNFVLSFITSSTSCLAFLKSIFGTDSVPFSKIPFTFLEVAHTHFAIPVSATQFKAISAPTNPIFVAFSVSVAATAIFHNFSFIVIPHLITANIAITFQAIFHICSACSSCGSFHILSISFQSASYTLFHNSFATQSFCKYSRILFTCVFISSLYSPLKEYFQINFNKSKAEFIIIFHHSYAQIISHFKAYQAFFILFGRSLISFSVI
ncbi:MAG: hypothetical protein LBF15_02435 [Candidatus Peribacteria bacterium]|jgi:hypothetical protein|nr:hypothetical protein [Candidatus Peribacteria bacterium]